jgi:hypothetical protein
MSDAGLADPGEGDFEEVIRPGAFRKSAATIKALLSAGYAPRSVVDAVMADDLSKLRHEGRFSVRLQPPPDEDEDPPATAVPA